MWSGFRGSFNGSINACRIEDGLVDLSWSEVSHRPLQKKDGVLSDLRPGSFDLEPGSCGTFWASWALTPAAIVELVLCRGRFITGRSIVEVIVQTTSALRQRLHGMRLGVRMSLSHRSFCIRHLSQAKRRGRWITSKLWFLSCTFC